MKAAALHMLTRDLNKDLAKLMVLVSKLVYLFLSLQGALISHENDFKDE